MMTSSLSEVSTASSLLYNVYTESLAPMTSVVVLAEYLAEKGYITTDTIDKLVLLEEENGVGLVEGKELLVNILLALGPAKVGEVKRVLREFSKTKREVSCIEKLDVKIPPSLVAVSGVESGRERERVYQKKSKKAVSAEVREREALSLSSTL